MASREVKSGRRKVFLSKGAGQGSRGRREEAEETSAENLALMALFTTATNPAHTHRHREERVTAQHTIMHKINRQG